MLAVVSLAHIGLGLAFFVGYLTQEPFQQFIYCLNAAHFENVVALMIRNRKQHVTQALTQMHELATYEDFTAL